jgi:squalene-hopene/tetraprenyl-beta-curcumene cyclase
VYVLRVAAHLPADDARICLAVTWLKTHQRASGYWYTRSPKNSDELSSYVGTAYAVLALKACGEIP